MFRRIAPLLLLTSAAGATLAAPPPHPAEVSIARPTPTTLTLRWHSGKGQPGSVEVWTDNGPHRTEKAENAGDDYRASLSGLPANSRVHFILRPYGDADASREEIYYTLPPKGTLETETLPLLAVVYTPMHYTDLKAGEAIPAGAQRTLSADDLALIRSQLEDVRDFYFRATHGKLNLNWEVVPLDKDVENRAALEASGDMSPIFEKDVTDILARTHKRIEDYAGAVFLYGWSEGLSPEAKAKVYRGQAFSGGTYGTDGPWKFQGHPYTLINFNHRADIRWTVTHEFGHQLDSMADYAGYPSLAFNHPDPMTDVGVFGEHWDANRWLLSHFPRENWIALIYGSRHLSKDTDEDGLADADPSLPMDEKRFGSYPTKPDTDGDGLSDLDEYTALLGVTHGLNEQMGAPLVKVDPRNPDSDGDGIKDGADPYPQYAVDTQRRFFTPRLDGAWEKGEWQPAGKIAVPSEGRTINADFGLQWDDQYLYVALRADQPLQLAVDLDADNDGWFAGSDNYRLTVDPPASGSDSPVVNSVIWDWSVFDPNKDPNPYLNQSKDIVKASDIYTASGSGANGYVVEIAIPFNYKTDLRLYDGKRLGVKLGARVPGGDKTEYTVFEPQKLMTMQLVRAY